MLDPIPFKYRFWIRYVLTALITSRIHGKLGIFTHKHNFKVVLRYYDRYSAAKILRVNIEIKTLDWDIQQSGVVVKII